MTMQLLKMDGFFYLGNADIMARGASHYPVSLDINPEASIKASAPILG